MSEIQRISLPGGAEGLAAPGPSSALYVMVMADPRAAKVGALERSVNAEQRLRAVERRQRVRIPDDACFPMRLALVAELDGLDVTGPDADEAWSRTTAYESLLRFVLARRFGRFAPWPDWIYLDHPPEDDAWATEVESAWKEIMALGLGPTSSW